MLELFLIQLGYNKRKITLCYRSDTETKRGENSIKISSTHPSSKRVRKELWELVIPTCDWFVLIWSQGLVSRIVHTKRFEEQVAGTSPKNSNQFEFVGLVAGTKF